jgi:hypothetical protein
LISFTYIVAIFGLIALWIESGPNIDQSYFATAHGATVDQPPPVEVLGTPEIADMHAVVDFKQPGSEPRAIGERNIFPNDAAKVE